MKEYGLNKRSERRFPPLYCETYHTAYIYNFFVGYYIVINYTIRKLRC